MSTSDADPTVDLKFESKRPLRLWFVALINILVGLLSVIAAVFLSVSDRVPAALQLSTGDAILSSLAGVFLVASSAAALYGNPRAGRWMLIAAVAFFGPIIAQNVLLLWSENSRAIPTQKLVANVFRNSLELWLNVWALRSLVTQQFFASRRHRPPVNA